MKLASNYPTRQQAVEDGGGLFVVVAASKRGAAAAERAALADDRAKFAGEEFKRTTQILQQARKPTPSRPLGE